MQASLVGSLSSLDFPQSLLFEVSVQKERRNRECDRQGNQVIHPSIFSQASAPGSISERACAETAKLILHDRESPPGLVGILDGMEFKTRGAGGCSATASIGAGHSVVTTMALHGF